MINITIIDYGSGNLKSVYNSVNLCSQNVENKLSIYVTNNKKKIDNSSHVILPGVGSFSSCLSGLKQHRDLFETINENIISKGKPFLGICVGMQMLFSEGHENGKTEGFGWIPGKVTKIKPRNGNYKIPHIGWNSLTLRNRHPFVNQLEKNSLSFKSNEDTNAYFVHSYSCKPDNKDHTILSTDYGEQISAMVARDNILGTQFHPEKSHSFGLAFLNSFINWKV